MTGIIRIFTIVILGALCFYISSSYKPYIENPPLYIEINNNKLLSSERIEEKISQYLTVELRNINIVLIASNLLSLPEIQNIEVKKVYPNKIVLDITEKQPVATWHTENKKFLIHNDGSIIQESTSDIGINIEGEQANTSFPFLVKQLNLLKIETEFAQSVKKAILIGKRRWDLEMNTGVLVKLPENIENISNQTIEHLLAFTNNYFVNKKVQMLDLRLYPNKVFFKVNKKR